jgi:hypothetical protein
MISLKTFISTIQEAIINANDSLKKNNEDLLNSYFEKVQTNDAGSSKDSSVYKPKMVILQYTSPHVEKDPETQNKSVVGKESEVNVPLITLVPLQTHQIEKIVLTSDFQLEVIDNEVEVTFAKARNTFFSKKSNANKCRLEITMKVKETTEGLRLIVEGYENAIKRQIT